MGEREREREKEKEREKKRETERERFMRERLKITYKLLEANNRDIIRIRKKKRKEI